MPDYSNYMTTIEQMRQSVLAAKGQAGVLAGLVALLENAPDSSMMAKGLDGIDPALYTDNALRLKVAGLLRDAEETEFAKLWDPTTPQSLPENVVSFSARKASDIIAEQKQVGPAGPIIGFDDVGGLEKVKTQMRRRIINPFLKKDLFVKFKRRAGGGVLMYGPPGCGKTMLARALAHECRAKFVNVKASDILDKWIGESEKNIASIFAEARADKPVVLFFDEIEALAQKRQFGDSHKINTTISTLLTEMDGFESDNEGVLIVGATNVPWSLDSAFRRPGRFDRTIFVPPPDKLARKFILKNQLIDRPVDPALDISPLINRSSGFSGADLVGLVDTALDYAIEDSEDADNLVPLSGRHFNDALSEVRASTGEWLAQADAYAEHANDDLAAFLKKYGR
jgi:SpoVK/Ycf46/Vps4 family AAA+-type ATPase